MKKFTIIYTYFNQKEWLESLITYWNTFYTNYVDLIDIIIVDDNSSIPALPVVKKNYKYNNIKVPYVTQDLGFGLAAARNLGSVLSKTDNILLLDLDTVITPNLLQEIIDWNYIEDSFYYRFFNNAYRLKLHNNVEFRKSSHTLYINKNLFTSIGGYPQSLNGKYGYDDHIIFDYLEIKLTGKYTNRKESGNIVFNLNQDYSKTKFRSALESIRISDMRVFDIYDSEYISRGFKIINKNLLYTFHTGKSDTDRSKHNSNKKTYKRLLLEKIKKPIFDPLIFLPKYELES